MPFAPPFHIRAARIDDAPAVACLASQLGYPCSPEQMHERLCRVLPDASHVLLVCPGAGSALRGWIHAFERFTIESGGEVEVAGLVVDADARGQGVGQALLQAVELWASQRRCPRMRLGCNTLRLDAHRFYQREGFEVVRTQKIFRKAVGVGSRADDGLPRSVASQDRAR